METTTGSSVIYGKYRYDDGATDHFSLDVSCITDKLEYQNDLMLFACIMLFAILIFMTFKLAFRGLWK